MRFPLLLLLVAALLGRHSVQGDNGRSLLQYGLWLDEHRIAPCAVNLGCYGRLGNQLFSVFCAAHAAHTLRSKLQLSGGAGCYADLLQDDPFVLPFGNPADCDGELDVNGWFGRPSVDPWDTDVISDLRYLYARMNWPSEHRPQSDELVIYLRAGDIFSERGPDFYLWAPCSFYDRIIEDTRTPAAKVTVVTDLGEKAGANPCTQYIQDKHPGSKVVSVSLKDDFGYLVHATNLVLGGVSTFGQLAAFMSPSLQHLFIFSWADKRSGGNAPVPIEPMWASLGYFDWPGVTPHHYLVGNYTSRLGEAIDIMTTFDGTNVVAMSGAEYWHTFASRGVNTINPWVPFTLTMLVTCEDSKEATLEKVKGLKLPWEALPGNNIERAVPAAVFVPEGWQSMAGELDAPMKYYRAFYAPSALHPAGTLLAGGDPRFCGNTRLPLAYVLQAVTANPFRGTHFLWLAHEAEDLKGVAAALPERVRRDQQDTLFFTRPLPPGSSSKRRDEDLVAALLPAALFTPQRLPHEWAARADAGMSWLEFLLMLKSETAHRHVHLHP